jgi:hypothetical protein
MVDIDGTAEYSKVVSLELKGWLVAVYPNPASLSDKLNIIYFSYLKEENIKIKIYNLLGKLMNAAETTLGSGRNEIQFEIGSLTPGTYFVELSNEGGRYIEKVFFE